MTVHIKKVAPQLFKQSCVIIDFNNFLKDTYARKFQISGGGGVIPRHLKENGNIIYGDLAKQTKLQYNFKGKNNILFLAGSTSNVNVSFIHDNSLVFIGDQCSIKGSLLITKDSVCFIDDYSTSNGIELKIYENKNIIIGRDCMFSWRIVFRTCDGHLIYSLKDNRRINFSKSIYIGDHVWIGHDSVVYKGAFIGSGAILGSRSFLSAKCHSNTINVGSPARELRQDVFWLRESPWLFSKEQSKNTLQNNTDEFKFSYKQDEFLSPNFIEKRLESLNLAEQKLEFLYNHVYLNKNKNRFAFFKDCDFDTRSSTCKNSFTNSNLNNIPNIYTSAKARIHSHLAYKLGLALIENSKSIKGYIRLPYVLSYIKDKHKAEQKAYNEKILKNPSLKLPPLESYPDYEAALKEKECLTYRLGEALMKANKEWYKGGYIKFYFESKRLRKEFKKRKLAR